MPLLDYQRPHYDALLRALVKNHAALDGSDTGTGKTFVALEIAKALGAVPFVVGPKSARGTWEDAAKLTGQPVQFVGYEKLRGQRRHTELTKCPIHEELQTPFLGPFIFKYTETEFLTEHKHGKGSYVKWNSDFYFLIIDEIHRCGGATSLNSKALIGGKRQAQYVLGLSATAADDPRQMKALGYTLGLHGLSKKEPVTYTDWLLRHGCTPGVFGGFDFTKDTEKQDATFRKINAEIYPSRGARMRKAEIKGFPETRVDIKLFVYDNDSAAKWASQLHNFNKSPTTLSEAMVCRQHLELLKIPQFVDMTEDYARSSKVVIFVNFTETRLRLVTLFKQLKFSVGQIFGDQTDEERYATVKSFQANETEVLVAMSQAASEAWSAHDPTGQVERTSLISPCDSGRQAKQILGRPHRQGGAKSLQFFCYFKDTYEEIVAERVKQKIGNIDTLNDGDFVV